MSDYTSDNIKNLQFPESVRLRPGMYIGSTDGAGIGVITREPLDNIVDEALEGHATQCDVHLSSKGIYIIDDGRGIPHGFTEIINPADGSKNKIPTLRAVFGVLHTSGKFNDEAYKISRGVHGVGVKSTNALSSEFEVVTFNKGKWRTILFNKGKLVTDVTECKAPRHPRTNKLLEKGTLIRFLPDKLIFKDYKLSPAELFAWSKMAAYFTPNLIISLSTDKEGSLRTLHYPAGPKQYLTDRIVELAKKSEFGLMDDAEFYSTSNAHDCILKFTSYDGCDARAFTNGLENVDGGFHVASMLNALREAVQPYATKKQVFTLIELRDGLIGLINAKMSGPQFTSQTKEKLADERAAEPLKALLLADFAIFFKKNRKLAEAICERSSRLKELKSKFVASKQMLTALKRISRKGLPAKAATAPKCKPSERELYLLEGDCFLAGTPVKTTNGTKSIEELTEPFVGVSLNPETGNFENTRMSASFSRVSVTEVVDIEFADGSIYSCTPEHEWLTYNRGYVMAKDLTSEDDLVHILWQE